MRDASLDDFLDGEREEDPAAGGAADREQESDTQLSEDIEPARPTSTFDPSGRSCESCGDVVERLWHDADAQVCGDCKKW